MVKFKAPPPYVRNSGSYKKKYRTFMCKMAVLYRARYTLGTLKLHPRSVRWKAVGDVEQL